MVDPLVRGGGTLQLHPSLLSCLAIIYQTEKLDVHVCMAVGRSLPSCVFHDWVIPILWISGVGPHWQFCHPIILGDLGLFQKITYRGWDPILFWPHYLVQDFIPDPLQPVQEKRVSSTFHFIIRHLYPHTQCRISSRTPTTQSRKKGIGSHPLVGLRYFLEQPLILIAQLDKMFHFSMKFAPCS